MKLQSEQAKSAWGKTHDVEIQPEPKSRWLSKPIYSTKLGAMYCGDSISILKGTLGREITGSAQLIFTSPPFPLNTKKRYGNLTGDNYINWFASYARLLKRMLKPDGSIVVEIGNAWEAKRPVMSTVVLRALLSFLEKGGLKLCQEFVWYNPTRLPSPIQWVNVERIRVKDAFTRVWWMSPTDRPKADNKRVLQEYSESMKKLIASGKYNSGLRPSQHSIGKTSFKTDNKGSIPSNAFSGDLAPSIKEIFAGANKAIEDSKTASNFLKSANTKSFEEYQTFCRDRNIALHPARMPSDLVEFFLKFLTEENDLVIDPFGGSNTTGAMAERMNRRWISIEADWNYATSSIGRFEPGGIDTTCRSISKREIPQLKSSPSSTLAPVITS